MAFSFEIEKRLAGKSGGKGGMNRARAGVLTTPHGKIQTPAFVTVGTKATVKALTPEQVGDLATGFVGAQVVLANTYHLYLEPGDRIVREAGGLGDFMNWPGPTMTDSGGFQVFSLGAAFGKKVAKIGADESDGCNDGIGDGTGNDDQIPDEPTSVHETLAKIDEDGVSFKSVIDGSSHRFTPERSMEIQHNIGADIMFAFDECTSPHAEYEYQRQAMERTHRWAERSLDYHQKHVKKAKDGSAEQALFGIVQGGRHKDLREESARIISAMRATTDDGISKSGFDGFGIGGSFDKEDMYSVVGWVNDILPEDKPRHLLGIGEPADIFGGIENGVDLFDCVAPTRLARNGNLYSLAADAHRGRININNAKYRNDFGKIAIGPDGKVCDCYTCTNYTSAYLSHLFRSKEMLAATLASIHNLHFIVTLVKKIRQSILDGTFYEFKEHFL
jgi:queuine tRNA-ribosyltransferase